ncbi:hypothetical protein B0T22DRAFT_295796 [Podospora appendiculata]|uniref:Uncharacterized protein n=1 Tax=Podospora appendiculata TaxID=314037 RepID=A0AAE0X1J9_9PEZI|nr:hypothetical protein B0T22DRAFT_295796 [Podospora appendiculata]
MATLWSRKDLPSTDDLTAQIFEDMRDLSFDPLNDCPEVVEKTKRERERVFQAWNRFALELLRLQDPDEVWIDLCKGCKKVEDHVRVFIMYYVRYGEVRRLFLGPEDMKWSESSNSSVSVLGL